MSAERPAENGCQDEASRMAAESWALLRSRREREARRLDWTLHYLTGRRSAEVER